MYDGEKQQIYHTGEAGTREGLINQLSEMLAMSFLFTDWLICQQLQLCCLAEQFCLTNTLPLGRHAPTSAANSLQTLRLNAETCAMPVEYFSQ